MNDKNKISMISLSLTGLVLAALSVPIISHFSETKKEEKTEQKTNIPAYQAPRTTYSYDPAAKDANMEIHQAGPPKQPETAWTGTTLTIEEKIRAHWATMKPVRIIIPELRYTDVFHVENGMNKAETQLYAVLKNRQYNYIITGINPATGQAQELLRQVINPVRDQ